MLIQIPLIPQCINVWNRKIILLVYPVQEQVQAVVGEVTAGSGWQTTFEPLLKHAVCFLIARVSVEGGSSAAASEEEIIATLLRWQYEPESSGFPCLRVSKILSYKYFAVLNSLRVNKSQVKAQTLFYF